MYINNIKCQRGGLGEGELMPNKSRSDCCQVTVQPISPHYRSQSEDHVKVTASLDHQCAAAAELCHLRSGTGSWNTHRQNKSEHMAGPADFFKCCQVNNIQNIKHQNVHFVLFGYILFKRVKTDTFLSVSGSRSRYFHIYYPLMKKKVDRNGWAVSSISVL